MSPRVRELALRVWAAVLLRAGMSLFRGRRTEALGFRVWQAARLARGRADRLAVARKLNDQVRGLRVRGAA